MKVRLLNVTCSLKRGDALAGVGASDLRLVAHHG